MTTDSHRRRGAGRIATACVGLLALLLIGVGAWLGIRGLAAKAEVDAVSRSVSAAEQALRAGDITAAQTAVTAMDSHAARARELLGDPLWSALDNAPVFGADVTAVRTSVDQVADVSAAALPVLQAMEDSGGGFSGAVTLLETAATPLGELSAALDAANTAMGGLAPTRIDAVSDAVGRLRDALSSAAPSIAEVSDLASVLPGMLGSDEDRHILVALQNPAEARTGGGIMGSFLMFTASRGHLTLVGQADSQDFRKEVPVGLPAVPADLVTLYGELFAGRVQNASMTADFPLTASMVAAWWRSASDVSPDAVVSIDPLVLRQLLALTGPLEVDGVGTIDAHNLIDKLLRAPYDFDQATQTHIQQLITGAAITQVLDSDLDGGALWTALSASAAQGRISLWSAHDNEQAVLASSPLGGPAARHTAAGNGAFVVGLNDTTGGKMDNYLTSTVDYGSVVCRDDARPEAVIRVSLHNGAAPEDVPGLSIWMTGGGHYGIPVGDLGTNITVAAPPGWFFGGVSRDGALAVSANGNDGGFPTSVAATVIGPGQDATLEFRFVAPDTDRVDVTALTAPLLKPATIGSFAPSCP